jgi:hypothetical protein
MHKRPTPFDTLTEPASLMQAWRRVRANRGAAGVDMVTLAEFERDLQTNLEALSARLREGRYYPMPVRAVQMRKASGGVRTLGILTVEDRIVQRAALDAIEPLFEPSFLDCSYGFRPNRSVELAAARVLAYRGGGDTYVVDADITDPVNALLSLGYTLLYNNVLTATSVAGLDPYMGYFHRPRQGHAALASDLMEEHRAVVVLTALNKRMVIRQDFRPEANGGLRLTTSALKRFLALYAASINETVGYPVAGIRTTYRQVFELQARHFARVVMGEELAYKPYGAEAAIQAK